MDWHLELQDAVPLTLSAETGNTAINRCEAFLLYSPIKTTTVVTSTAQGGHRIVYVAQPEVERVEGRVDIEQYPQEVKAIGNVQTLHTGTISLIQKRSIKSEGSIFYDEAEELIAMLLAA